VRSSFSPAREKLRSVATVRKTFSGYSSIGPAHIMRSYAMIISNIKRQHYKFA
jgi:hypothetical protein